MQDIEIKQALDKEGAFSHLELIQGNNIIKLSIGNSSLDSQFHNYKWDNLKKIIDKIQANVQETLNKEIRRDV